MEFETVLKQALDDVEAAKVPPELRSFAFAEAVKHYTAQLGRVAPNRGDKSIGNGRGGGEVGRTPVGDPFGAVVEETGVSREDLERVFYIDGEAPAFNVSARKLGANKADRHRAIALLMTCMRHYGLDETEVDLEIVRETCVAMGTYDRANFSSYVGSIPGITLSGPRGKKVLRPRPEAKARFKEKIAAVLGTTDSSAD